MKQLCAKLREPIIFADAESYASEMKNFSYIYKAINRETWQDNFDKEARRINFPLIQFSVQTRNCFSSEKSTFSLSADYIFTDVQKNYYPFYVLYTRKTDNVTTVFAYVSPDPTLANDENVKMMETEFHDKVKDMDSKGK